MKHIGLISLCMAVVLPTWAAPAAEARFSLTDFAYRVTDLDPTDGRAAGIQFTHSEASGTGLWVVDNVSQEPGGGADVSSALVSGLPFDAGSVVVSRAGIDAVMSKTDNALHGQAAYSSERLQTLLATPYRQPRPGDGNTLLLFGRRALAMDDSHDLTWFPLTFTVAPKTSVTFTAQVDTAAYVDVTSDMLASESFRRAAAEGALIDLYASSRGMITIYDPADLDWTDNPLPIDGAAAFAAQDVRIEPTGRLTSTLYGSTGGQALALSFANDSDVAVERALRFYTEADLYLHVGSVPENGTLASMVTGLATLGMLAWRRRGSPRLSTAPTEAGSETG